NSSVKTAALDLLMAAYQQTGNAQKVQDTANRLLQADPNFVRALALLTFLNKQQAEGGCQPCVEKTRDYAQRGLESLPKMPRPEGLSEDQYVAQYKQYRTIFEGALGFAALQAKDYPTAQQYLTRAVQANPTDFASVYQLGIAYLEQKPLNTLGFWYIARAANLAPTPQAKQQVADGYGKPKYRYFHGDVDGWDQIMASVGSATAPPAGFTVAPAPSPAEQVERMMRGKQVKDMSLDDIALVLQYGS